MTIKEATLQALDDLKNKVNNSEIYTYLDSHHKGITQT
jgi:hypothetical protein